ncbi:alpha/beta hydrolase [Paenibacillus woosongensis]|uniref:Alpha/beta hydrolase n=1 Tax=Paenibacillus woosongensis TaxID=307580 RepID=A0AA95KVK6_9BACL|nr:alpha/beta hydrolase [Paenibacillus woosongensis]WHX51308.1 alpha/beta hydrolase [Paenibacillus woosongensis]
MKKETHIYKQVKGCTIQADIYSNGKHSPVLMYIHGGALMFGSRSWLPLQHIELYYEAGFTIVSIDYRLAPQTKLYDIVQDIRDAIRWIKSNASQRYGFDADKLVLMGGSAGGYLSLLMGTMELKPKAIVSFYGYGDILGDWVMKPSEHYCQRPMVSREEALRSVAAITVSEGEWDRFNYYLYCRQQGVWLTEMSGLDPVRDRNLLEMYNPLSNVREDFPPTLLLHGDKDTDVPYEQSVLMYEQLCKFGVPAELITIPGADHVFDQHFAEVEVQDAFRRTIDFMNEVI